ncbi:Putative ZIP-like zinc transporter protein [Aspergillus calidoustus]|uniref:Putative ZIP-like zinc transporter protein n=2 Tax=Aspergillus calidoustus TaxID=454130 RepID=A0A0U5FR83_ASPCI|nr:Putative ZIP-like zinc transporter protein [Aspergillus calidoustus]
MEGLFTLLVLSAVMTITSFVVGSLPLAFKLSPSQLRLISSLGMGVLVGTSLIVIIPEGVETLYDAVTIQRKSVNSRSVVVAPLHERATIPTVAATFSDLNEDVKPWDESLYPTADAPAIHVTRDAHSGEGTKRDTSDDHSEHEHSEESSPHAWIGIALISGFILMYLIDKMPEFAAPAKQQKPPYHISLDNLGSGLRRNSSPARDGGLLDAANSPRSSHSFATTTGLVIHAAADGIALGASTSDTGLSFIIFLAIMVHKAPASFGLTSILLRQGLSSRAARAHLLVFSLAAPVGALITFLFVQLLGSGSTDETSAHWRTGVLLLFSAGTFLYVAMHTMQENNASSSSHDSPANGYDSRDMSLKSDKSMRDLVASVIGMILPLFLQIGHAH